MSGVRVLRRGRERGEGPRAVDRDVLRRQLDTRLVRRALPLGEGESDRLAAQAHATRQWRRDRRGAAGERDQWKGDLALRLARELSGEGHLLGGGVHTIRGDAHADARPDGDEALEVAQPREAREL